MGEWIISNRGNGAYAKAIQLPNTIPAMNDTKPDRAQTIFMLTVLRDNLEKLVENPLGQALNLSAFLLYTGHTRTAL
jgi:hypothetical protein